MLKRYLYTLTYYNQYQVKRKNLTCILHKCKKIPWRSCWKVGEGIDLGVLKVPVRGEFWDFAVRGEFWAFGVFEKDENFLPSSWAILNNLHGKKKTKFYS